MPSMRFTVPSFVLSSLLAVPGLVAALANKPVPSPYSFPLHVGPVCRITCHDLPHRPSDVAKCDDLVPTREDIKYTLMSDGSRPTMSGEQWCEEQGKKFKQFEETMCCTCEDCQRRQQTDYPADQSTEFPPWPGMEAYGGYGWTCYGTPGYGKNAEVKLGHDKLYKTPPNPPKWVRDNVTATATHLSTRGNDNPVNENKVNITTLEPMKPAGSGTKPDAETLQAEETGTVTPEDTTVNGVPEEKLVDLNASPTPELPTPSIHNTTTDTTTLSPDEPLTPPGTKTESNPETVQSAQKLVSTSLQPISPLFSKDNAIFLGTSSFNPTAKPEPKTGGIQEAAEVTNQPELPAHVHPQPSFHNNPKSASPQLPAASVSEPPKVENPKPVETKSIQDASKAETQLESTTTSTTKFKPTPPFQKSPDSPTAPQIPTGSKSEPAKVENPKLIKTGIPSAPTPFFNIQKDVVESRSSTEPAKATEVAPHMMTLSRARVSREEVVKVEAVPEAGSTNVAEKSDSSSLVVVKTETKIEPTSTLQPEKDARKEVVKEEMAVKADDVPVVVVASGSGRMELGSVANVLALVVIGFLGTW